MNYATSSGWAVALSWAVKGGPQLDGSRDQLLRTPSPRRTRRYQGFFFVLLSVVLIAKQPRRNSKLCLEHWAKMIDFAQVKVIDYAQLKVPELKKILTDRALPISGNKADLIARLQDHDKKSATTTGTRRCEGARTYLQLRGRVPPLKFRSITDFHPRQLDLRLLRPTTRLTGTKMMPKQRRLLLLP